MIKLSEHFTTDELKCKCGKCSYSTDEGAEKFISRNLILLLEAMRVFIQAPIEVSSGIRCLEHNKAVGGEDNSAHLRGEAADIKITGSTDRYDLIMAAMTKGCRRIGVYKDQHIIHVDVSTAGVPLDVLWVR